MPYFLTLKTDDNFNGDLLRVAYAFGSVKTPTFDSFLDDIANNLPNIVEEYAKKTEVKEQGENDIGDVFGYEMTDEWKVDILEDILDRTDTETMECMLGEYGIMNAIRHTDRGMTIKELGTDDGIRDLFNDVVWDLISLGDGVKEVDEEEYLKHFPVDKEDKEEEEEEEEDEEEDEEDDEDEDKLWDENLAIGDKYSLMMKKAMEFAPNDREGQIAFLSVLSHGTFNGLVRWAIEKEDTMTATRIS
jgi:hypothetical protein